MSNELQQARYDQLIRRVGVLYGGGAKVTEVLSDLFPTIDVENIPGELMWLSGWRLAVGLTSISPGAGVKPQIQLFNPVGSGKIMVLTKAIISTNDIDTVVMGFTDTALSIQISASLLRDLRTGVSRTAVGQIRQDAIGGALTPLVAGWRTLAETPYTMSDENGIAVLTEGTGVTFAMLTNLRFLQVTFFWRERTIEPSEALF